MTVLPRVSRTEEVSLELPRVRDLVGEDGGYQPFVSSDPDQFRVGPKVGSGG